MEKIYLTNDVIVFGLLVENFPSGIADAFKELIKKTGDNAGERAYYGISEYKDGKMAYYATAEEKAIDEAEKYECNKIIIDKGVYLASTVVDWRKKTECIKDVFYEIISDSRVNKAAPAIEWYKNDVEMMCLVKMKE